LSVLVGAVPVVGELLYQSAANIKPESSRQVKQSDDAVGDFHFQPLTVGQVVVIETLAVGFDAFRKFGDGEHESFPYVAVFGVLRPEAFGYVVGIDVTARALICSARLSFMVNRNLRLRIVCCTSLPPIQMLG